MNRPQFNWRFMYAVLRLKEVIKRTGLAKCTIYKKMSEQTFPKPIPLSTKAVGWLESDINKWFEERIQEAANDNQKVDYSDVFKKPVKENSFIL